MSGRPRDDDHQAEAKRSYRMGMAQAAADDEAGGYGCAPKVYEDGGRPRDWDAWYQGYDDAGGIGWW